MLCVFGGDGQLRCGRKGALHGQREFGNARSDNCLVQNIPKFIQGHLSKKHPRSHFDTFALCGLGLESNKCDYKKLVNSPSTDSGNMIYGRGSRGATDVLPFLYPDLRKR
jgi:hypothetical protein